MFVVIHCLLCSQLSLNALTMLFSALHARVTENNGRSALYDVTTVQHLLTHSASLFFLYLFQYRRIAAVSMGVQLLSGHVEPQPSPWGYQNMSSNYQRLPGFRRLPGIRSRDAPAPPPPPATRDQSLSNRYDNFLQ